MDTFASSIHVCKIPIFKITAHFRSASILASSAQPTNADHSSGVHSASTAYRKRSGSSPGSGTLPYRSANPSRYHAKGPYPDRLNTPIASNRGLWFNHATSATRNIRGEKIRNASNPPWRNAIALKTGRGGVNSRFAFPRPKGKQR